MAAMSEAGRREFVSLLTLVTVPFDILLPVSNHLLFCTLDGGSSEDEDDDGGGNFGTWAPGSVNTSHMTIIRVHSNGLSIHSASELELIEITCPGGEAGDKRELSNIY